MSRQNQPNKTTTQKETKQTNVATVAAAVAATKQPIKQTTNFTTLCHTSTTSTISTSHPNLLLNSTPNFQTTTKTSTQPQEQLTVLDYTTRPDITIPSKHGHPHQHQPTTTLSVKKYPPLPTSSTTNTHTTQMEGATGYIQPQPANAQWKKSIRRQSAQNKQIHTLHQIAILSYKKTRAILI